MAEAAEKAEAEAAAAEAVAAAAAEEARNRAAAREVALLNVERSKMEQRMNAYEKQARLLDSLADETEAMRKRVAESHERKAKHELPPDELANLAWLEGKLAVSDAGMDKTVASTQRASAMNRMKALIKLKKTRVWTPAEEQEMHALKGRIAGLDDVAKPAVAEASPSVVRRLLPSTDRIVRLNTPSGTPLPARNIATASQPFLGQPVRSLTPYIIYGTGAAAFYLQEPRVYCSASQPHRNLSTPALPPGFKWRHLHASQSSPLLPIRLSGKHPASLPILPSFRSAKLANRIGKVRKDWPDGHNSDLSAHRTAAANTLTPVSSQPKLASLHPNSTGR